MKKIILVYCTFLFYCTSPAQQGSEFGEWVLADTMKFVTHGASTLLNSGKVLVAGTNSACELYDYINDEWQVTDSMNGNRSGHVLITLKDGKALVMGGANNEIYDENSGKWEDCASFIIPRYSGKAILLQDGKVLYTGGWVVNGKVTSSCELYDPFVDEWELVDSLTIERIRHGINLMNDGRVIVTGGESYSGYLNQCEIFDPVTKEWTEVAPMYEKHVNHASLILPDGRAIVLGGEYNENSTHVEVYNPVTNEWTKVNNIMPPCDLNRGGAFLISNKRLLIIDKGAWGIYDTESFISLGYFYTKNYSLYGAMCEILPDSSVIIMGGTIFKQSGATGPSKLCEIFKPTITSIKEEEIEGLGSFQLYNNYPNPFNPGTVISYRLPIESKVTLKIYDLLGQEVMTLIDNELKTAGKHEVLFNAEGLPTGIYYYRLITNNYTKTNKMLKLN